jgi:hypothetical protein
VVWAVVVLLLGLQQFLCEELVDTAVNQVLDQLSLVEDMATYGLTAVVVLVDT